MEVEKYGPETGEVTFKTTHLSDYVIYIEEDDPSVYLENAFTFLSYSTRENGIGGICASYEINYEAISMYENPIYKIELLESKDVITISFFIGDVKITEVFEDKAEVSASANDVLG